MGHEDRQGSTGVTIAKKKQERHTPLSPKSTFEGHQAILVLSLYMYLSWGLIGW